MSNVQEDKEDIDKANLIESIQKQKEGEFYQQAKVNIKLYNYYDVVPK